MQFNHYGVEAALLAAGLVNTPAPFTPLALKPLLEAHHVVASHLTGPQAAAVESWSKRLAPCFGPQTIAARCQAINALLAAGCTPPHISLHDGHPHLHYDAPDADAATRIQARTAGGLAYVVCVSGPDRLGRCRRCDLAFVDSSRNGRRAYCTIRCANNAAVARHRDRKHP